MEIRHLFTSTMTELRIEPNPKKMRWAVILVNPAAHTKELVGTARAGL